MKSKHTDLLSSIIHKYINESFKVFINTPKYNDNFYDDTIYNNNYENSKYRNYEYDHHVITILKSSELFRSQLQIFGDSLNQLAESIDNNDDCNNDNSNDNNIVTYDLINNEIDEFYDMICSIEKSWQLCEIFLLNPTTALSIEFTKWMKDICYDVIPLDILIFEFNQYSQPERSIVMSSVFNNNQPVKYWDLIYELTMQGNLFYVCELLKIHSELSGYLNGIDDDDDNSSNRRSSVKSNRTQQNKSSSSSSSSYTNQCIQLFDILSSHPYAKYIYNHQQSHQRSDNNSTSINSNHQSSILQTKVLSNITIDFKTWQSRVMKLRRNSHENTLLISIPELDTILRIILGDGATIDHQCNHSLQEQSDDNESKVHTTWVWAKLVIAKLLYIYPPPLGAIDLSRIIEECINTSNHYLSNEVSSNTVSSSSHNNHYSYRSDMELSYISTLREVMAFNIGPTLKSIYQLSIRGVNIGATNGRSSCTDQLSNLTSTIPLLCTAHLALLLVTGAGIMIYMYYTHNISVYLSYNVIYYVHNFSVYLSNNDIYYTPNISVYLSNNDIFYYQLIM